MILRGRLLSTDGTPRRSRLADDRPIAHHVVNVRARTLEAHRDWDGSRKREAAVTDEDSLVAAWGKRWHALPAMQARRETASRLACHLRATAVHGDYRDGEPVHTG